MKLERFREKNHKKTGIIVFTITCILLIGGVFLYTSFASFQVNENFNVISGNVKDIGDITFTYYIDDTISLTGEQAGILSDSEYGRATIKSIYTKTDSTTSYSNFLIRIYCFITSSIFI